MRFRSDGTEAGGLLEGGKFILKVVVFGPDGAVRVSDITVTCRLGDQVPRRAEEGVTAPSIGLTEPIERPHRFTLFENV